MKVEGVDKVKALLADKKHTIGQKFIRMVVHLAQQIAIAEKEAFPKRSKGSAGYWTGQTVNSIGKSNVRVVSGTISEVLIGPGMARPLDSARATYGAWLVNFGFANSRRGSWFVPFKDNPGLQQWAKDHGLTVRKNKSGQITGGIKVGGPNSRLREGINFKGKAEAKIMPLLAESKKMFYQELHK